MSRGPLWHGRAIRLVAAPDHMTKPADSPPANSPADFWAGILARTRQVAASGAPWRAVYNSLPERGFQRETGNLTGWYALFIGPPTSNKPQAQTVPRYAMSRRCELSGKTRQIGHKVSHSNRKTKRRFLPNLLNVTLISDTLGRSFKLRVSAHAFKTVDHRGGLDAFLAKAHAEDLSPKALKLK